MSSSDKSKLGIIRHFLLNSPPGEIFSVAADVKGLLKNDSILSSIVLSVLTEYNHNQFTRADFPDGSNSTLITVAGKLNNGEYMDPATNSLVIYDHVKQQVTNVKQLPSDALNAEVEPYRKAFESSALEYISKHYQEGVQVTYGSIANKKYKITTCINSSLFNAKNYWGGRWKVQWDFVFGADSESVDIKFDTDVLVHYYEEGNVQMHSSSNGSRNIPMISDAKELAKSCFDLVKDLETKYHEYLEKSYTQLGSSTFKALRRLLPVTRSKMEWDKISSYRAGQSVSQPQSK